MKIPKPKGQRYVVGDIHGCISTFEALLQKINPKPNDQLFLLGDYVDRGKGGKQVIDLIMELPFRGIKVFLLRGNHEQTLLDYNDEEFRFLEWHCKKNNLMDMLHNGKIKDKYLLFLNSLPYYYLTDGFILVHASVDFEEPEPFNDLESMLWSRKHTAHPSFPKAPRIIHGHSPVDICELKHNIKFRNPIICLDTGAAFPGNHKFYVNQQLGFLSALNLDTWELTFQENVEL